MTGINEPSPSIKSKVQERLEAIGDQLRLKISSKIQVSTFLAGFSATILTIQITILWQVNAQPRFLPVSIALMVAAIILYSGAIFTLDALTMPKRFWKENKEFTDNKAARFGFITDDDLWEIQKRMLFYWNRFTLVATSLAAISLVCIILPMPIEDRSTSIQYDTFLYVMVAILVTVIYLAILRFFSRYLFSPLLRPHD